MTDRRAVVIGINYAAVPAGAPPGVVAGAVGAPLVAAEADEQAVATFLGARGYSLTTLFGTAATRTRILEALGQERRAAGTAGALLLYFAGYGDVDPYYQDRAY